MGTPLFRVDAFTDTAFRGNPAAVCLLDAPADEAWMQAARGRDEPRRDRVRGAPRRRRLRPAVVHPDGRGRAVRPRDARERARALRDGARARAAVAFHTAVGAAHLHPRAATASRWTSPPHRRRRSRRRAGLLDALGDHRRAWPCSTTSSGSSSRSPTPAAVEALTPDLRRLETIVDGARRSPRARIATGSTSCRACFGPGVGIDEDPVTGSAHCALAPYWAATARQHELVALPGVGPRRHPALPPRRRPRVARRPRGHRPARRASTPDRRRVSVGSDA